MAQFVGTIDRFEQRRVQFVRQSQRELEAFFGSPAQSVEHADLAMVSWSQSWEPFHHGKSAAGEALIWGHAMERQRNISIIPDLVELWRGVPEVKPLPLEGIHAAFLYRSDGSWAAAADILGVTPVYYYCGEDFVIVGSSPELFRCHPDFRADLDPVGLTGILLSNGLVNGRSLLKGVQRLGAGRLLHACPGSAPREMIQYIPELSDKYFGFSYQDNFERMQEVLGGCFDRHLDAHSNYGLVLSGGLDSRLIAGALKQRATRFTAVSLGSVQDIEIRCASAVAKSLGIDQQLVPIQTHRYPEYAASECKWKQLANGFSSLMFYQPLPDVASMQGGMLSGYIMECVIGGDHISWAGEDPNHMSFGELFKKVNRWGVSVGMLKRLFANSFGVEIVDDVVRQLEQNYNSYSEREFHKSLLFGYRHRARYHTSVVLGMHSNWPWPVVPYIDTRMLDLMGGMPYEHIKKRRMQYHLLKERFPKLARVTLDRNSFNMKPVVSPYGRAINHLLFKPREYFYRWTRSIHDRRIYYRSMDFNSVGWNAVRMVAEPHRKRALQFMDETTLSEILPRPGQRLIVPDGIMDSSAAKLLTGFLMWSARYL